MELKRLVYSLWMAVDTYGQFVDENEKLLRKLPPPPVAVEYYESEDLYM